jgi:hypothetical protein
MMGCFQCSVIQLLLPLVVLLFFFDLLFSSCHVPLFYSLLPHIYSYSSFTFFTFFFTLLLFTLLLLLLHTFDLLYPPYLLIYIFISY